MKVISAMMQIKRSYPRSMWMTTLIFTRRVASKIRSVHRHCSRSSSDMSDVVDKSGSGDMDDPEKGKRAAARKVIDDCVKVN